MQILEILVVACHPARRSSPAPEEEAHEDVAHRTDGTQEQREVPQTLAPLASIASERLALLGLQRRPFGPWDLGRSCKETFDLLQEHKPFEFFKLFL